MNYYEEALKKHKEWEGKLSVELKMELKDKEDLSIAYTPGVAEPCLHIQNNPDDAYLYTWKGNTIAVITDGSAVLGLGDIGAQASLPVMEGKCVLFKAFAGVNAVPLLIDTDDPEEIIRIIKAVAPTYGGINLEDIKAPNCVKIERRLIEELDIPVFHDDQHGTAIVVTAALINALKLVKKNVSDITLVLSGAGSAGSSILRMLTQLGIKKSYVFDSKGLLNQQKSENYNFLAQEIAAISNPDCEDLTMAQAMAKADVFIGVSVPNIITKEMVASMKKDAIVFPLSNPEPEIAYELAKEAGARIVGTGRSDYPNQINNVLAFPGLFKGALAVRSSKISEEMKIAAAEGIASLLSEEELRDDYIIASPFDPRVAEVVADSVARKAKEQGLARISE